MNTQHYTTTNTTARRDEARKRTEAATYASQVKAAEARSKRLDAARQATAAFLGYDDGDVIFA